MPQFFDADLRRGSGIVTAMCMSKGKVRYADDLPELAKEFAGYVWDAKADGDKPVKVNDHLMDALRYGVATLRMWKPAEKYVSPFERGVR